MYIEKGFSRDEEEEEEEEEEGMTAPNMATITASLERSLQNCSLNHHRRRGVLSAGERSSSSDDLDVGRTAATPEEQNHIMPNNNNNTNNNNHNHNNNQNSSDATLELNSHISLPYQWEQCLDLKTGEIYYINWTNGMKAKEDPRVTQEYNGDFYSEEEEEDGSSYDSEESSSESSPPPPPPPPSSSSRDHYRVQKKEDHVLVVAGCKSCLMYFMVPKQVEDCPKCNGQLLHFDRSENGFP